MKKTLIVLALAVALTFMFAATAFADHSPSFYVEWDPGTAFDGYNGTTFGNAGTGSPHQNYLEGTEKCGVCHAVHRAPVPGVKWDTNPSDDASRTAVAGGQYNRAEFEASGSINNLGTSSAPDWQFVGTQMLLSTNVANSCDYCHIITSIGGKQLYAGKPQYRTEGTGLDGSEWDAGFAHHNGCTGCHAVHGVSSNYGNAALWGTYGTFQGPIKSKILKVRAKGAGGPAADAVYNWQEETIETGSNPGGSISGPSAALAAWIATQPVSANVDPLNVPLFSGAAAAINGTDVRPGTSAYDAQSGVFCTFCHQNYGFASEATVNPDGDRSLFQGPWYALAGTVPNVAGAPGTWVSMNSSSLTGKNAPFKNHPVKSLDTTFVAAGQAGTVPREVAFAGAETCVSCHDAGQSTGAAGLYLSSYPHFTPGYFHFTKTAAHLDAPMTYAPYDSALGLMPDRLDFGDSAIGDWQAWLEDSASYEEAVTVADGQCLKCHVNAADDAGVGKTY